MGLFVHLHLFHHMLAIDTFSMSGQTQMALEEVLETVRKGARVASIVRSTHSSFKVNRRGE